MSDLSSGPVTDEDFPEPPRLRALRRLVGLLTAALIIGVLTVAAALVIKIAKTNLDGPPGLAVEQVALPVGEQAISATAVDGGVTVLTVDADGAKRLRLFGLDGASLGETSIIETP